MSDEVPGPAYRIRTPRLIVRCWNPEDAPLLKAAIEENVDHLRRWMPWAHDEPQTLQQKIQLLREFRGKFDLGEDFVYAIFDRAETQVLGGTGLHTRVGEGAREIGYWIHEDHLNQGLATEAAGALTKVAFEIENVQRVEIHCDPENVRSAAIPRKLGYTHEATLRRHTPFLDKLRDAMIWTLFDDEYPDTPAAAIEIAAYGAAGRRIS